MTQPFLLLGNNEICYVENQSDNDRYKSSIITALQEFGHDGKMIEFVYKMKQTTPWTQFFTANNQTFNIKNHCDYFTWGEMITLLLMYLGGRFFSLLTLEEIFAQCLFGKNIQKHQWFDYSDDLMLSTDDPRPIKEQAVQNVIAHWIPKFIVDAMQDLITDETGETSLTDSKCHTLTYKDPTSVIAPTVATHLESYQCMKFRLTDDHSQNSFGQYRHLVEQEIQNDELRDFLSVGKHGLNKEYYDKFEHHFKLALHASPFVIQERVERASKYPEQNLAQKYARER